MTSLLWEWIALGYAAYLLMVSMADKRFVRARIPSLAGAAVCSVVIAAQASSWVGQRIHPLIFLTLIPLLVLLVGYWLSGLFFIRPMLRVEQWLMALDDRLLRWPGILAAYSGSPRMVHELVEIAYVLVYAVIPAGAATLAIAGRLDAIPRFWTVVLLAEFISYGMMPWLQTRPPRVLEGPIGRSDPQSAVRRLNVAILARGSIQANTVPSGHAAGAVATGLAIAEAMPLAGVVFLIVAAAIVVATVLGRYHYLLDSLLGIIVAAGVWWVCR